MAISEAFGHAQLMILSVQAVTGTGMTSAVIRDIRMLQTNTGPKRSGVVDLLIDGIDTYTVNFTLTEEAIDQRTIQGYTKRSNPTAVTGR